MADLIRDAPVGQIIRYITSNKILQYPEERPDFQCPSSYSQPDKLDSQVSRVRSVTSLTPGSRTPILSNPEDPNIEPAEITVRLDRAEVERINTFDSGLARAETAADDLEKRTTLRNELSRISTKAALGRAHTRADLEQAFTQATQASLAKEPTRPIIPERTSDGTILVDWYTTDDPENPQNWSYRKKAFASLQIYLYTLAVYIGSAIYTPSIEGVMEEFGVGVTAASLGLALYVLAYGIGPLIFSPLSEIPAIGRNLPYMVTMGIFVCLCVAAPLVENYAGLMVVRFLQGFFGSPCLATGGASLQDIYSLLYLPYVLTIWALAATCGPALGPIVAGFSVAAESWRWSLWEMLWLSGPIFIMMMLFLPETSSANILLRRAQRLRAVTGDARLKAQSEIDQANMNARDVAFDALVRPMQLIIMDPAIGFTAGYVALCYAIFYSFFEAFPLVYVDLYHFNLGEMGLSFLAITVAVVSASIMYYAYLYWILIPDIKVHGLGAPERRLVPALIASVALPTGLFVFAWTGNGRTHWIVSLIGVMIFTAGVFLLIQCVFVYLPLVYPQYAASLFAGNDFARSSVAFAAILFSRPMFVALGIGSGVSLLGAFTAACVAGIFILFFYGDKLRARSRFSAK